LREGRSSLTRYPAADWHPGGAEGIRSSFGREDIPAIVRRKLVFLHLRTRGKREKLKGRRPALDEKKK